MKKITLLFLIMVILSGCQTTGRVHISSTSYGPNYNDEDWSETFYTNCMMPKDSISWKKENNNKFLRFKLKGGQKGGCRIDRRARTGAPFWERAEIKQISGFDKSKKYDVEFLIRFVAGFKGLRENFFQIHQSVVGCRLLPIVMLKVNYSKIQGDFTPPEKIFNVNQYLNKWVKFNIILDFEEGVYSVKINNNDFIQERAFREKFRGCGVPHIKFGIYRPGYVDPYNNTSIIDFDKFQIKEL